MGRWVGVSLLGSRSSGVDVFERFGVGDMSSILFMRLYPGMYELRDVGLSGERSGERFSR